MIRCLTCLTQQVRRLTIERGCRRCRNFLTKEGLASGARDVQDIRKGPRPNRIALSGLQEEDERLRVLRHGLPWRSALLFKFDSCIRGRL
jgi:hypothetical protein